MAKTAKKLFQWGCVGTLALLLCVILFGIADLVGDREETIASLPSVTTPTSTFLDQVPLSRASDTSTPTISPETAQYLVALARQAMIMGTALQTMGDLLQNPRLFDEEWRILVAAKIAAIRLVYEEMTKLNPPQEAAEIHYAVLDAASDCNKAMDYLVTGLDNFDSDALNQAQALILSCGAKFEEATALVDNLLSDGPPAPVVNTGANLRAGPGTNYPRIGGAAKGTVVTVVGRNETGDWLVIENPHGNGQVWIAAFLIDNPPNPADLPIVQAPPVPSSQQVTSE